MKIKCTIAVSLGLIAMLTFGCRSTENVGAEKLKSLLLGKAMGDALTDKILLTEIREGRVTNALELMEFSMDCSIMEMEHATNSDAATQKELLQTLTLLKEYRQKYPRKVEAVSDEGDDVEQDHKITKDANEFLEQVGSTNSSK
jgi:hypothetical protein